MERKRLHFGDATGPTRTEHRPGLEAFQKPEPLIVDRDDDRLGSAFCDRRQHFVGDDAGMIGQSMRALSPQRMLVAAGLAEGEELGSNGLLICRPVDRSRGRNWDPTAFR